MKRLVLSLMLLPLLIIPVVFFYHTSTHTDSVKSYCATNGIIISDHSPGYFSMSLGGSRCTDILYKTSDGKMGGTMTIRQSLWTGHISKK